MFLFVCVFSPFLSLKQLAQPPASGGKSNRVVLNVVVRFVRLECLFCGSFTIFGDFYTNFRVFLLINYISFPINLSRIVIYHSRVSVIYLLLSFISGRLVNSDERVNSQSMKKLSYYKTPIFVEYIKSLFISFIINTVMPYLIYLINRISL